MIPYVNATLTAITPVGTSADYDTPATDGTPRWTGTLGIYVAEEVVETIATPSATSAVSNRIDEILQTRLELPYTVGRLVKRGDTLTYTYEGAAVTRTAGTLSHAPLVGRVRVLLENA
jgi:hypothetical protein